MKQTICSKQQTDTYIIPNIDVSIEFQQCFILYVHIVIFSQRLPIQNQMFQLRKSHLNATLF